MKTGKARSRIKSALREDKRKLAQEGKVGFLKWLKKHKINNTEENIKRLLTFFSSPSEFELHYQFEIGKLKLAKIQELQIEGGLILGKATDTKPKEDFSEVVKKTNIKEESLVIGENMDHFDYTLSPCCNPIPGDEVFGFITIKEGIKIHKTNCPNAVQLMSNYAYRIVKARWTSQQKIAFLAGLKITGIDEVGLVNNVTKVISNELNVNMRSISFDSNDGVFEGTVMVFVHDTKHLKELKDKLRQIDGVISVSRIDS